jgi:DNA-binding transcriptional LysR family regulator
MQLVLPRLAARFRREAPGVRIRMIDSARGAINRLLQEDAVDLVLEAPQTPPDLGVSSALSFVSTFVIAAAKGHPKLAGVAPLDLFCAIPQALRSITGDMSGVIDEALAQLDVQRTVVLAVPHFHGVALAAAQSDLIAALPAKFANAVAEDLGLALYQTPMPSPASEIRMFWHSRHDKNLAHQWIRGEPLGAVKDRQERLLTRDRARSPLRGGGWGRGARRFEADPTTNRSLDF